MAQSSNCGQGGANCHPSPIAGRAILDRQALHVHDLATEVETEFPEDKPYQQRFGTRTILVTPLLREGVPIGTIVIRRMEVKPSMTSRSNCLRLSPPKP